MIRPWPTGRCTELLATRVFRVTSRSSVSPRTGQEHDFVVVEAPPWVNVVPLDERGRVVLIRQYRHGRRELTWEIPGGMMDPGDIDPAAAARRELLEETGELAHSLRHMGTIAPNPAIQDNLCYSFLATDLESRGAPQLDGAEDIETARVPLHRIPAMIAGGQIQHALVVVAFCFLLGLGEPGSGAGLPPVGPPAPPRAAAKSPGPAMSGEL